MPTLPYSYFWFIFTDIVSVTSLMPCEIVSIGTVEVSSVIYIACRAISDLKSEFRFKD